MDVDAMRAARPAKPFASGSALDYALHVANFERVTNKPTASSKDKIEELAYWFSGDAREIINSYVSGSNADENLAMAKSELDRLYKGSKDTLATIIQGLLRGDPIKPNDYNGHIKLYASLKNARAAADTIGAQSSFMDEKTIFSIVTACHSEGTLFAWSQPNEEESTKDVFEDDVFQRANGLRLRKQKITLLYTMA